MTIFFFKYIIYTHTHTHTHINTTVLTATDTLFGLLVILVTYV